MTSLPIFSRAENKTLYWLQMAQQSQMSDEYRRETERMIRQHEAGCGHKDLAENMCAFLCRFAGQQIQATGHALSELILRRDQPLSKEDRASVTRRLSQWQQQHQAWAKEMYDIEVRTVDHPSWPAQAEHHRQIDRVVRDAIAIVVAEYGDDAVEGERKPARSSLTDKQLQALQVVGQHHGNYAAAARTLQKDRKTVEEHYRTALRKLFAAKESLAAPPPRVHATSLTQT